MEYPKLKPGDTITCKDLREAQSLGTNLVNEGFDYIIHGRTIHILEAGANGKIKRYSSRDSRNRNNAE